MLGIVTTWFFMTSTCALVYVADALRNPGLEGYEADWTWQLMFFGITRLPYFVGGLVVALVIGWCFTRGHG
jgi:hypothetical protein